MENAAVRVGLRLHLTKISCLTAVFWHPRRWRRCVHRAGSKGTAPTSVDGKYPL